MRTVVIERDGVGLAELLDGDHEWLAERDDGAFDADPDDRPPLQNVHPKRLGVIDSDTGELLGLVSWHATGYGRGVNCAAWNIGIGLLPSARGRGVGTVAQRLLAERLFASTPVDRVEASTETTNLAERKALRRAGFRAEGVARGVALRDGVRRDYVLFGLLRTDLLDSSGERVIVARRDGIGLAEPFPGDTDRVYKAAISEFDLDLDRRPSPVGPTQGFQLLVIDLASGEVLGGVSWHAVDYGVSMSCAAWNIGIALLPAARGHGVGTAAQRLLVERLFATTSLDRIEAGTDVDNLAEQRALEKAGLRREGVLRGAQLRGRVRRDLAVYGIIRADL